MPRLCRGVTKTEFDLLGANSGWIIVDRCLIIVIGVDILTVGCEML